ncbi:MAG: hypothetical protein AB7G44_04285 [Bacteroidia bacterium]
MKETKTKTSKGDIINLAIKSSALIFPMLMGVVASFLGILSSYQKIKTKEETQSVKVQVENLTKMSEGLKGLQIFIEEQKQNLVSEEIALKNLKEEKANLEPLVEADKKMLEAVFIAQEKRQRNDVWYERAFGFFIGIFSSLVASLLFLLIQRKIKMKSASAA